MNSSRLIFAAIENVKSSEEAQTVAVGRLNAASEKVYSLFPAKYVRAKNIESGVAFFLEDSDGRNIVNQALRLNRILGGGIHSVETKDYGNEAYCFYTTCPGEVDEISELWQKLAKRYFGDAFIECIIHPAGKKTCYVTGVINRCFWRTDENERQYALACWQQKVNCLCEGIKCCRQPRFVPAFHNSLD